MKKYKIITNNPRVKEKFVDKDVSYFDIDYRGVLIKVREQCLIGYKLLSHPLSGSVKPNETPYKSIMISTNKYNDNTDSLLILDKSIATYDKFPKLNIKWKDSIIDDFQEIDLTLITSAIEQADGNMT